MLVDCYLCFMCGGSGHDEMTQEFEKTENKWFYSSHMLK